MTDWALAVDVGGTKLAVGLVAQGGSLHERASMPTRSAPAGERGAELLWADLAGEEAAALSSAMTAAWTAFAAAGDPSSPESGDWPAYEAGRRATMVLGARRRVVDGPQEDERRFLDEHLGRYGLSGPIEGADIERSR